MSLPFTEQQFLGVFKDFNEALWPLQLVLIALALAVAFGSFSSKGVAATPVLVLLSAMWAINGVAYHIVSFRQINPPAMAFGILFLGQALLLAFVAKQKGSVSATANGRSKLGIAFVAYALAIYPILGSVNGHGYPYMPMLGVAPCPTTIFTLGVLLMVRPNISNWLFAIPLVWSLIATAAAINLGMVEDFGLTSAAVVTFALLTLDTMHHFAHRKRIHEHNLSVR